MLLFRNVYFKCLYLQLGKCLPSPYFVFHVVSFVQPKMEIMYSLGSNFIVVFNLDRRIHFLVAFVSPCNLR